MRRFPWLRGDLVLWNKFCIFDHLTVACSHNHYRFYHLPQQKPWIDAQNQREFEQQYTHLIQVSPSQRPRHSNHSLYAPKLGNSCKKQVNLTNKTIC